MYIPSLPVVGRYQVTIDMNNFNENTTKMWKCGVVAVNAIKFDMGNNEPRTDADQAAAEGEEMLEGRGCIFARSSSVAPSKNRLCTNVDPSPCQWTNEAILYPLQSCSSGRQITTSRYVVALRCQRRVLQTSTNCNGEDGTAICWRLIDYVHARLVTLPHGYSGLRNRSCCC